MQFAIANRFTGNIQFIAEIECSEDASVKLGLAVRWGHKTGADLEGADLEGADLRGAYLKGANLKGAYLKGAYLRGANGVRPELFNPLLILLDQPGKIRAYKLVTAENKGPYYPSITYADGTSHSVEDADTSLAELCGSGIHLATLNWCLRSWEPGYKILIVEFEAQDIAAIPHASDGKFRLHRCTVIGEKKLDYVALGLASAPCE